jgi:hypothetical protein
LFDINHEIDFYHDGVAACRRQVLAPALINLAAPAALAVGHPVIPAALAARLGRMAASRRTAMA